MVAGYILIFLVSANVFSITQLPSYWLYTYSATWELGTPNVLSKTVLNSEVVLFLRSISM